MGKQLAVKLRIHARLSTTIKNLIKVQPVSSEMFEAAGTEKNMHCLIMKEIELEAKRRTLLEQSRSKGPLIQEKVLQSAGSLLKN